MHVTRRRFLAAAAGSGIVVPPLLHQLTAAEKAAGIRVGVCDWSFGGRNPKALAAVREIGLDGVQISPAKVADHLSYADPAVQQAYREQAAATGVQIASLAMTITNGCPLASDPRGPAWLEQTIDATHALGAKVILMAFFGRGDLRAKGRGEGPRQLNDKAVAAVVERLKVAAPMAREKGVILGLENTLSARQNMAIMEAVGNDAVQVYYDIANSTRSGYDVPGEIRLLGRRICQFHFKDNKGQFNSGDPEMGPIVQAVKDIDYRGWIILERGFGKDKAAYFRKNGEFVRHAFGLGQS